MSIVSISSQSSLEEDSFNSSLTTIASQRSIHFVLFVIGTTGDITPMIALAQALTSHGHKCTIATHKEFESKVKEGGLYFARLAGNPEDLMDFSVSNGLFTLSFFGAIASHLSKYLTWVENLFETALEAAKDADVIIESPICMIGRHVAEKLSIPILRASPFPWAYTSEFPHPLLFSNTKNEYKIKMGYSFLTSSWSMMLRKTVNHCRKKVGLESVSTVELGLKEHTDIPIIHSFSSYFVDKPSEWNDNIHLTGYWFQAENPNSYIPPPDVVAFLKFAKSSTKPLVYIGFGSVIVSNADNVIKDIIQGITLANVNAVFARGWLRRKEAPTEKEHEEPIAFPDNILVVDAIPHSFIFPQVDLVIHHGGAGTTAAGLKCGKPTIIKPFFGDQRFWGGQVEKKELGCVLSSLDAMTLATAITNVLSNEKLHQNALKLGSYLLYEDGLENAVENIMFELKRMSTISFD